MTPTTARFPAPLATLFALSTALLAPPPAAADGAIEEVAVTAGVFNVLNVERSAEAGFELRLRSFWESSDRSSLGAGWVLRPAAGAMATSEGALYGYAGFRLEVPLGARWLLVPQSAAGYYERGDEKELGGSVQFRSGLELAYAPSRRHRVGAVFYHLSNAGLERPNPGSESLVLYWSWR